MPSIDSGLLEASRSIISKCLTVFYSLVLCDEVRVLKACVGWLKQPLLSNHLKFYLALQRCEKMCAQGPTPYSFAPLKVTTGGRRYAAIGTECDNASSSSSSTIFDSTSTSWSSQDSCSTLLIEQYVPVVATAGLCLVCWRLYVAALKNYNI